MTKAGYIKQLASGIFTYLHFGKRSLSKIENILREEMNRIDGDEICMPIVHPAEVWKRTNRWYEIDESLVRFKDRTGREMVLAMTHEEVIADLCATEIESYNQLPKLIYQIYTKFRDETRSRGGLIRVREFTMKDSYSLDRDEEGMAKQYVAHYDSYFRIFARLGLPAVAVKSDTGMMGGRVAHEFMYLTPIGEDTIFISEDKQYRANKEVATFKLPKVASGASKPIEKVFTPAVKTIKDVANYLGQPENAICKAVIYTAQLDGASKIIMVLIQGDLEINTLKLEKIIKTDKYKNSTEDEILSVGAVPGFASAINVDRTKCLVIGDNSIINRTDIVVGANEVNYHIVHAAYGRDFIADTQGDLASAYEGALSPLVNNVDSKLEAFRGVEIGNIFQLGTKYTEATNANFIDESGVKKPIVMGSYGIGVGRLLACICEEHKNEKGMSLPITVAPYEVHLVGLLDSKEITDTIEKVYNELISSGIEVLYDDRNSLSAGVKFADADLIGIPIRVTISKKSIQVGGAEIKLRKSGEIEFTGFDQLANKLSFYIAKLKQEMHQNVLNAETWPE